MVQVGIRVRRHERGIRAAVVSVQSGRCRNHLLVGDLPKVVEVVENVELVDPEFRCVPSGKAEQVVVADLEEVR